MANPQKENGYVPIANELFDALARIRINGESRQVLDVIFRKTYGFNKKEDAISLSQFCLATGLKKQTVCKALKRLKTINIITQKDNVIASIYRVNKDFDTWKPLPKKITLPKKVTSVTQKGKNRNPKRDIQKTVTKDTITKDNISEQSSREIEQVFEIFYKVNPTLNWGNTTQRGACLELIKKIGIEKTVLAANYAVSVLGVQFAPAISTPHQLKEKLTQLIAFKKRSQDNKYQIAKI